MRIDIKAFNVQVCSHPKLALHLRVYCMQQGGPNEKIVASAHHSVCATGTSHLAVRRKSSGKIHLAAQRVRTCNAVASVQRIAGKH